MVSTVKAINAERNDTKKVSPVNAKDNDNDNDNVKQNVPGMSK